MINHKIKELIERIAEIPFVRTAIEEEADLAEFKESPSLRVVLGLITIGISYTIGWPFIALLGIIAAYFQKPLIIVVGGPLMYGMSHLTFMLGMYLAGSKYAWAFLRWAVKITVLKLTNIFS
jgi:hypothetical protein